MDFDGWIALGTLLTAVGTVALAVITALLAWFARNQVVAARLEARIGRTLAACEKYDLDPVLGKCLVELRNAHRDGSFKKQPTPHYDNVVTVLNYFESIGIAIDRDLYDVAIVKDHFSEIFQTHFNEYFGETAPRLIKEEWFTKDDFARYLRLCKEWSEDGTGVQKAK